MKYQKTTVDGRVYLSFQPDYVQNLNSNAVNELRQGKKVFLPLRVSEGDGVVQVDITGLHPLNEIYKERPDDVLSMLTALESIKRNSHCLMLTPDTVFVNDEGSLRLIDLPYREQSAGSVDALRRSFTEGQPADALPETVSETSSGEESEDFMGFFCTTPTDSDVVQNQATQPKDAQSPASFGMEDFADLSENGLEGAQIAEFTPEDSTGSFNDTFLQTNDLPADGGVREDLSSSGFFPDISPETGDREKKASDAGGKKASSKGKKKKKAGSFLDEFNEEDDIVEENYGDEVLYLSPKKKVTRQAIRVLKEGIVRIGRTQSCSDIVLANPYVSEQHATIQFDHGRYYLTDVGSLNGTTMDGKQLSVHVSMEIRPESKIVFANALTYYAVYMEEQ